MKLTYFPSIASKAADLNEDVFRMLVQSSRYNGLIDQIRAEQDHGKRSQLKRALPAITWQSYFPAGSKRSNGTAQPTGLFMLDIDHVKKPAALWELCKARWSAWGSYVALVHITPGGEGLRIVCRNFGGYETIAENQAQLARFIGLDDYDEACKDFARLSFICKEGDILYQNFTNIPNEDGINIKNTTGQASSASDHSNNNVASADLFANSDGNHANGGNAVNGGSNDSGSFSDSEELTYKDGITYEAISKELVEAMGGEPHEGSRNTFLYRFARKMRYIVDFNAFKLAKIVPTFGLPQNEVENVCQSACKSARSEKIPYDLYMILQRLEKHDEEEDVEIPDEKTSITLPVLPPIFKQLVRIAPDDFKEATIFALLPIIGTLASRLRSKYLDGELHAPNFMTVIEAPQASGKSFARKLVKTCMKQLEYQDAQSRIIEQQYMMQLKRSKNSKNQPEEPTAIVRMIPASVSIAKLLKRLSNAKGLHLFSFTEELDTLTKSNKAGAWSQKSDIYRNAFDNADYGQEYMSENSFSGIFPVFYNMLMLGTPNAVRRFYNDPEDGLISRVIFVTIPDQFGAKMPVFKKLTSFELRMIENICSQLNDNLCCTAEQEVLPEHVVDLAYLNKALEKWTENQRLLSVKEVNLARNIFYRRSAVMGFRAGMLAHYLWKGEQKHQNDVRHFACYVADYVLNSLIDKYSTDLEKTQYRSSKARFVSLWDKLEDKFTTSDVLAQMKRTTISSPLKQIIFQWVRNGYCKKVEKNTFVKINKFKR